MIYYIVSGLLIFACTIYYWLKTKYSYWSKRGIVSPPIVPVLGNFSSVTLQKQSYFDLFTEFYNNYADQKYIGVYIGLRPTLIVRDPEVIKQILIKDFSQFQDRGVSFTDSDIEQNLFFAEADVWRVLRHRLTPIFTTGKLKTMIPLVLKSMNGLLDYADRTIGENGVMEMRSLASKYTLDVIGSCAFGVEVDAFSEKENVYREIANRMLLFDSKVAIFRFINSLFPGLLKTLGVKSAQKDIFDFFVNMVNEIVKERFGKPKVRKDFMDFMIELKEQGRVVRRGDDHEKELEITNELMAAQAFIFYLGGFETSSGTMSFLMHEISQNLDIQERLHKEISEVIERHGGVTYEAINEMRYLEMVLDETLRKYPILGVLVRQSISPYTFPNSKISLEKGTSIIIPVYALHYDPQYFPNPLEFDPERFSPENKAKLPSCVYLPFGDGPRNCIGMRFAKVQSMIGLAGFLHKYRVEPTGQTKRHLEIEPKSGTLTSKDGIWVNVKRR
ncbi:Cytochrome P450 6B2 [Eumeta japonica]|uniref:unspecific monooxygenase n=1 Tax=Eumeta variegata TaxID=151549 RepID=A0A4C1Y161_EUMVA|nr:Cytochrome P450 6B2 [Eumeta japonica]